ncbi:MAG: glycosyltransferase [Lachnospiraceae bacterium]|nr:glycosyltransferase [Lachnospiraceae bacterium]
MKKRIIIVTNKMQRGGVESALIPMLQVLVSQQYDITLLLIHRGGEWESRIPQGIMVEYADAIANPKEEIISLVKKGKFISAFIKAYYTFRVIHSKSPLIQSSYQSKLYHKSRDSYDIAISYYTPTGIPTFIVKNRINAKEKIVWIHFDISMTLQYSKKMSGLFNSYNQIICVSKDARDSFIHFLRNNKNISKKTFISYNLLDTERIDRLKDEVCSQYDICSVGRLVKCKGFDIAIKALRILQDKGLKLSWAVCGGGYEEERLKKLIAENQLEDSFFLLGSQDNPYKFINHSRIYVQTSLNEGYCLALQEARYLKKPIITTRFSGALEQIIDGETGLIVEATPEAVSRSIEQLINNAELQSTLIRNLQKSRADNTSYNVSYYLEH